MPGDRLERPLCPNTRGGSSRSSRIRGVRQSQVVANESWRCRSLHYTGSDGGGGDRPAFRWGLCRQLELELVQQQFDSLADLLPRQLGEPLFQAAESAPPAHPPPGPPDRPQTTRPSEDALALPRKSQSSCATPPPAHKTARIWSVPRLGRLSFHQPDLVRFMATYGLQLCSHIVLCSNGSGVVFVTAHASDRLCGFRCRGAEHFGLSAGSVYGHIHCLSG